MPEPHQADQSALFMFFFLCWQNAETPSLGVDHFVLRKHEKTETNHRYAETNMFYCVWFHSII